MLFKLLTFSSCCQLPNQPIANWPKTSPKNMFSLLVFMQSYYIWFLGGSENVGKIFGGMEFKCRSNWKFSATSHHPKTKQIAAHKLILNMCKKEQNTILTGRRFQGFVLLTHKKPAVKNKQNTRKYPKHKKQPASKQIIKIIKKRSKQVMLC